VLFRTEEKNQFD